MAFVTLSIESTSRSLALNDALVRQVSPIAGGWILPRGEYLQYLWRPGGIGAARKIRGISPDIKILILAMHSAHQLDLAASVPIDSRPKFIVGNYKRLKNAQEAMEANFQRVR